MSDTVNQIYRLLDARGIVAPCYLKPQFGNPLAKLETDLHLDSLDTVDLHQAILEDFNIDVPDDVAFVTVRDVATFVDGALALRNARAQ